VSVTTGGPAAAGQVTRLLLWRHGETEWNAIGRFQGQLDSKLSDAGRGQAARCAARLAEIRPDAIVSSDLSRAVDTATALAALTGQQVTVDPRFRERCFGAWEGHTRVELEARWPGVVGRWIATGAVDAAGAETPDELSKRVHEALRDLAAKHSGATVVVSTHGGTIRAGIGAVLDWPAAMLRTLGTLRNCHWSELRHDPARGWLLHAHNVG
jgi:probable phosphoglycerate mutase